VSEPVVLPVPEILLAVYAVATPAEPDPATFPAAGGAPEVVIETLPTSQAPLPSSRLLRALGTPEPDLLRIGAAQAVTVVRATGSPGWPPAHELQSRHVARRIAAANDGIVIDLWATSTLPIAGPVVDPSPADFRLTDWVKVTYSLSGIAADEAWLTTKGLGRFGLPELQVFMVPERYVRGWMPVLSGIAYLLLRQQWDAVDADPLMAFWQVERVQRVTLRDIALAYSDRARHADDPDLDLGTAFALELDLAVDDDAEPILTVVPPDGVAAAANVWPAYVVGSVFAAARRSAAE
jgi:hypothetical protein